MKVGRCQLLPDMVLSRRLDDGVRIELGQKIVDAVEWVDGLRW